MGSEARSRGAEEGTLVNSDPRPSDLELEGKQYDEGTNPVPIIFAACIIFFL